MVLSLIFQAVDPGSIPLGKTFFFSSSYFFFLDVFYLCILQQKISSIVHKNLIHKPKVLTDHLYNFSSNFSPSSDLWSFMQISSLSQTGSLAIRVCGVLSVTIDQVLKYQKRTDTDTWSITKYRNISKHRP